jgi:hypothetical protein
MQPCPIEIRQSTLARPSIRIGNMLDVILTTLGIFGLLAFIGIIFTVLLDNPSDY